MTAAPLCHCSLSVLAIRCHDFGDSSPDLLNILTVFDWYSCNWSSNDLASFELFYTSFLPCCSERTSNCWLPGLISPTKAANWHSACYGPPVWPCLRLRLSYSTVQSNVLGADMKECMCVQRFMTMKTVRLLPKTGILWNGLWTNVCAAEGLVTLLVLSSRWRGWGHTELIQSWSSTFSATSSGQSCRSWPAYWAI